ncbi:MAG TPA: hypothetical protein VH519_08430 [Hyphomicrobiaceae bacterium]|jgi:hypothetical protein
MPQALIREDHVKPIGDAYEQAQAAGVERAPDVDARGLLIDVYFAGVINAHSAFPAWSSA